MSGVSLCITLNHKAVTCSAHSALGDSFLNTPCPALGLLHLCYSPLATPPPVQAQGPQRQAQRTRGGKRQQQEAVDIQQSMSPPAQPSAGAGAGPVRVRAVKGPRISNHLFHALLIITGHLFWPHPPPLVMCKHKVPCSFFTDDLA